MSVSTVQTPSIIIRNLKRTLDQETKLNIPSDEALTKNYKKKKKCY